MATPTILVTIGPTGETTVSVQGAAGLGVEAGAYRRYLTARYQIADGETPECALSEAHVREERERFVRRYQDAGVARGFREQCARLAGARAA